MKSFILAISLYVFFTPLVQAAFLDVNQENLNYNAIDYVQSKEIVSGYPDNTYKPYNKINRAEFTKIIVASKFSKNKIENCIPNKTFPDVPNNEWFFPYICVAGNNGIIQGHPDGTFNPGDNINFAEAATIIVKAFGYEISEKELWYQSFVEKLEAEKAIPTSIYSFGRSITRGEMAEMIYRLKENITNKPSTTFFTGDTELNNSTTFVKAYRFYDFNYGWGVWPTEDDNYIFTGWSLVGLQNDAFISKINRQGEQIWTKLIGSMVHYSGPMGTGPADDIGYITIQLKDGSYLLAGQTNGYVGDAEAEIFETPTDVFLSKFDEQGNHIWTETVGDLAGDTPVGLWPIDDGGFLLYGTLGELGAGAGNIGDEDHYFFLAEFDTEGKKEWIKKTNLNIGGTMGQQQQVNFFIEREEEDGFVLVGNIPFDEVLKAKNEEIMYSTMDAVVKLDKDGQVQWAKSIEAIPTEYLITEEADNEIGYTESYMKVRSAAGNFSAVQRTPDDGYLAVGLLSSFTNQTNYDPTYKTITGAPLLAVKLDKDGNYQWAKTIKTGLLSFDNEFRLVKTKDNDFLIMRNYMTKGEEFVGDPYDTYMKKSEEVSKLYPDDYKPGDEEKNPALKKAMEERSESWAKWGATMTNHISLMKVDPEFNVKWMKTIGPEVKPIAGGAGAPYEFKGSDIQIDNDRGIVIAGTHGTDVVCFVSFGEKFYCNDALLIKLDNNGNLGKDCDLVSDYRTVLLEDLSQFIITRDLEPKIFDYELGIKKQKPTVLTKTARTTTTLSLFEEKSIVLNERETLSFIANPEITPTATTWASIYYRDTKPVETENEKSREVHEELLPILNELFDNEVKLRDNFGGISLDYVFSRLVTEEDILAVQEGLEKSGYILAMELEDGKLVMSKVGRTLNLLFSTTNKRRGTLNVTY